MKKNGISMAIIMGEREKKKGEKGMVSDEEGMGMSKGMGMDMHDLGETPKKTGAMPSDKPSRPYYPSIRIPSDKLPGLADKKIGDKFVITAEAVIKGADARDKEDGEQEVNYDIEVRSAALGKQKEGGYVDKGKGNMGIKEALISARNGEKEEME